ncbi:MAG: hypothetical protein IIA02_06925 [Proteobacteria bacterium]|uniref:hypothetical protein n=1 Tax=Aquabacterium sp. TaxID=1872578 RepID=UPI0035C7277E|nr:hypothetical protein [Pseudomonadota bacterium]
MASVSASVLAMGARWRWQLAQALRGLWRRQGWAAVAVLAGTVLGALAAGMSVWQREALRQELAAQVPSGQAPRRAEPIALSEPGREQDRARLQAFLTGLPSHRDIPSAVQTLLTLADQHGVAMLKGDYQFQPDANAGFARYRMSLPVRGSSTQVRRFLGAALKAQPSLGVESVQLRREQVSVDQIEARVEWVLYTRLPEVRP